MAGNIRVVVLVLVVLGGTLTASGTSWKVFLLIVVIMTISTTTRCAVAFVAVVVVVVVLVAVVGLPTLLLRNSPQK